MTAAQQLFPGYEPPPDAETGLSADRKRTLRQADEIRRGIHPLTKSRVHVLSDTDPQPTDAKNLPYRCGSCVFRVVTRYHNHGYPKCLHPGVRGADEVEVIGYPHASHGAASDVRAWWPACRDYSGGDTALSPDAARYIPQGTP